MRFLGPPAAAYHKVWVSHGPAQNKQTSDSERKKTRTCRPRFVHAASCAKSLNASDHRRPGPTNRRA